MVGCGRLIIFVVSGSFCSLQLGSGGAALLPAVQKLANILSKVSETGTAPRGGRLGGEVESQVWSDQGRVNRAPHDNTRLSGTGAERVRLRDWAESSFKVFNLLSARRVWLENVCGSC